MQQNYLAYLDYDLDLPRFSLSFGRPGQEIQRQLTPTILSLYEIHQGVEYFDELNPSVGWKYKSLPATKNHQGLEDSEDESDAKIISVLESFSNFLTKVEYHLFGRSSLNYR